MMLTIRNLTVAVEGRRILDGLDLDIAAGEVHALMAPTARARARSPTSWPAAKATKSWKAKRSSMTKTCSRWSRKRVPAGFSLLQHPVEIPA